MKIQWKNEKRALKDLIEWDKNPRQITEKQAEDLRQSLEKFGVASPIIVNTNGIIIGGHQRMRVLRYLVNVDPNYEVDVRIPDRELTEAEVAELNIRLNKNVAEWDFDLLANNFELDNLYDWGFEEGDLGILGAPKLEEREREIRTKEMFHVLISVPVDMAIDLKEIVSPLEGKVGVEVVYSANG